LDVFWVSLHGVIMRVLLIAVVLFSVVSPPTAYTQQREAKKNQQSASVTPDPCPPVNVVIGQSTPEPQTESTKSQPQNWYQWFWPPVWSNWALVAIAAITAKAAIRTLRAIDAQVVEMRKTGEQTDKLIAENIAQSKSMAESVRETARFASGMEGVAKSLEVTAEASQQAAAVSKQSVANLRQQMRAWLTVIVGGGMPQDRTKNQKFDARPAIHNSGLTPARNVRHRIKSGIFPIPLPDGFDQSVAAENETGGNLIGAHQSAQMFSNIDDYVPDQEVEDIKIAKGRGVYAWGVVTYEDIFGETHTTTFCQQLTYLPNNTVFVYYIPGRNDAD
jgi:hypothetical protein